MPGTWHHVAAPVTAYLTEGRAASGRGEATPPYRINLTSTSKETPHMTTKLISNAKQWARTIKRDVHAVWLSARDPRTPRFAKVLALVVAAYAVSPIDLIPDFIPVLGYVDDLIIVPLGIMLVVRLIPLEVMNEHRKSAAKATERPVSRMAAGLFIVIWIVCADIMVRLFL
ncbi:MAG: DUF1232 domain-containing protein [Burkholderiales bacterium]|nr:DUF1232 domain-containing protein [Burkholderiales bacterium]